MEVTKNTMATLNISSEDFLRDGRSSGRDLRNTLISKAFMIECLDRSFYRHMAGI